jgi:hypothetical protein
MPDLLHIDRAADCRRPLTAHPRRRRPLRRGFVYRRLSGPPAKPGRTRFLRRSDAHGRPSLSQVK